MTKHRGIDHELTRVRLLVIAWSASCVLVGFIVGRLWA